MKTFREFTLLSEEELKDMYVLIDELHEFPPNYSNLLSGSKKVVAVSATLGASGCQ